MNRKDLFRALARVVGQEDVLTSPRDLIAYSYDATGKSSLPDVVVFPNSTAEVSAIMKIAYRDKVPVVARGAGTNLTGGTIPSRGGIVLELSRLNRILEIDTDQHRAFVEPGVVNLDLQNALKPMGFMYAPDPASQKSCTLGGNIGENAGGPHCLKYGVTSNHVYGLELVMADGQVVQVGTSIDDSYGYDLLGPIVGSEGTLGIVTRLVLRIMRMPESFQTMLAIFGSLEDASRAVSDIIAAGIIPGALELMDNPVVRAVEASVHAGYPLDAEALLLIELEGLKEGLEQLANRVADICRTNNCREVKLSRTAIERELLWQGRRSAFGAVARVRPAYSCQDATVPRDKLVPMLREVREIAEKYQLLIGNVCHAGDGNFHPLIMFDHRDQEETERVEQAGKEILNACLRLDGTISGEHGIGLEKQKAMSAMFRPSELGLMRKVKSVFDPEEILNPGKVLTPHMVTPPEDKAVGAISGIAKENKSLYDELVEILGVENVLADSQELAAYEVDGRLPALVVFPLHIDHICKVVGVASKYGIFLTPSGNGSKQAMGLPLTKMDVIVSLKHMNRLLELDATNLTARVETGINHAELQRELAKRGLYFPLEPADMELSTIGGSLATSSSGPGRLAYGGARDLVLGLTVVTPSGEAIRAGGKTMKNVAGYDMCKLFLGSWGTLGVIAEAIIRLLHLPEEHRTLMLKFSNIEDVCQIVGHISNSFLQPESMELIDVVAARSLGNGGGFRLDNGELLLLVGVAGSSAVVERHNAEVLAVAKVNNVMAVNVLSGAEEDMAWATHKRIQTHFAPGMTKCKVVIPINKLGDMFQGIQKVAARHQLHVSITGHVGNGILRPNFFVEGCDNCDSATLLAVAELLQSTDKIGGFFMVESGTPETRQACDLISQRSDYELMRRLKRTFDPKNIFNPGKVVRIS